MKYMGSKARFAKYLLPFILQNRQINQLYWEPFVGGCNMIDKVTGNKIASDSNYYLIEMWKSLQRGWLPPVEITRTMYNDARSLYYEGITEKADYIGYIGFNGSYGGRFFDGGYAGITKDKFGKERNYPLEAYNNIMSQINKISDVEFIHGDYRSINLSEPTIIYLDKPYENTKAYSGLEFDHEACWDWCRQQKKIGHQVFISEYNAPNDFKCLVSLNAKSSLSANGVIGASKNSIEKLFTI